jgi:hypothetical protein
MERTKESILCYCALIFGIYAVRNAVLSQESRLSIPVATVNVFPWYDLKGGF